MKTLTVIVALSVSLGHPALAEETILDVYQAIGDTAYFPLRETLDGHTITNSFDWRLDTTIDEDGRFLAYREEGAGWSVTAYKFWPFADGGAIAVTSTASFVAEVMYADTYVQFFAHGPGDAWGEIDPPIPFVDASDFLSRSPEPASPEALEMLNSTEWALYHEVSADSDLLTIRLTATNRDKCWPENVFGSAQPEPSVTSPFDFCRDLYAGLTTELKFALSPGNGRFKLVTP